MTLLAILAVFALALFAPLSAWACPACALSGDGGGFTLAVFAAGILFPFVVALVVFYALKNEDAEPEQEKKENEAV